MSLILQFLFVVILSSHVAAATGVAVVQSAAPVTDTESQNFVSSGFGTPVCAMFFGGYGTANGTVVDHAGLWIGFSDFTNEQSMGHAAEDSSSTTDTGASNSSTALRTLLSSDQSVDGTATAATITDGVSLTWADAPPSAYLITAVLFNADVISNCAVGTLTLNTTEDATASVTGLGWQPDVVLAFSNNNATSNARTSFGFGLNDGGIVQFASGQNSQNGAATSDISSVMRNDRLTINPLSDTPASPELTSFDTGGFTVTTRDGTTTNVLNYMAMKLASGVGAKLLTCTSPTSTGAHSCTGTGFAPQAGIMLQSIVPALNTFYTSASNNESYGLSAFTAATASTSTIADDDATTTANTESVTDSKPVRLRKDAADFMTATSTGAQADGWDFSYTVTDSTARYRAALFFESIAVASSVRPRGVVMLP